MNPSGNNLNNNPDDEQLDAMLSDVQVPPELKDRLCQIASASRSNPATLARKASSKHWVHSRWLTRRNLAIAAALVALTAFLSWSTLDKDRRQAGENSDPVMRTLPKSDFVINDPNNKQNDDRGEIPVPKQDSNRLAVSNRLEQTEQLILEIELRQLRSRLARLNARSTVTFLDPLEYESIILALADQAVIELGGNETLVASDMAIVIEQYPNTQGAIIAQHFINTRSQLPQLNH